MSLKTVMMKKISLFIVLSKSNCWREQVSQKKAFKNFIVEDGLMMNVLIHT